MSMKVSTEQGLMSIAFDRPQKKNAITAAMYATIADALESAGDDASVRCILIHGDDEAFTAGNDVADFLQNPPQGADSPVVRFLRAISTCAKPVVAAVNGVAIGVGTTMLLHCDLVYCGESAKFSTPFTRLALCPEAASSLLLPALAGYQRAAEKLLLGESFGADDARDMGLVVRVLADAQTLAYARAQAAKLVALPASSLRTTKRLMKQGRADAVAAQMDAELGEFARMLVSPEAREVFSAFLAKRTPDFSQFE
ncbi:MAG: enoyl-CoA hydratase [Burkholderiaceae bacterium]|nr:enoyl-CoA hydratase [Burkholderiaceae bacterium]